MVSTPPVDPTVVFGIDDEPDNLGVLVRTLSGICQLRTFVDPRDAVEAAPRDLPVVIVTDFRMPGLNGVEVIQAIRRKGLMCTALLVTAYADLDEVVYAQQAKLVYRVIPKPIDPNFLRDQVHEAVVGQLYKNALRASSK